MEELSKLHPVLYSDLEYFEIGSGWFHIIHDLTHKLIPYDCIIFEQIKQKFGELRIYYKFNDLASQRDKEEIHVLIQTAEREALTVCELCGISQSSLTYNDGYYQVLCFGCCEKQKDSDEDE